MIFNPFSAIYKVGYDLGKTIIGGNTYSRQAGSDSPEHVTQAITTDDVKKADSSDGFFDNVFDFGYDLGSEVFNAGKTYGSTVLNAGKATGATAKEAAAKVKSTIANTIKAAKSGAIWAILTLLIYIAISMVIGFTILKYFRKAKIV